MSVDNFISICSYFSTVFIDASLTISSYQPLRILHFTKVKVSKVEFSKAHYPQSLKDFDTVQLAKRIYASEKLYSYFQGNPMRKAYRKFLARSSGVYEGDY